MAETFGSVTENLGMYISNWNRHTHTHTTWGVTMGGSTFLSQFIIVFPEGVVMKKMSACAS